MSTYLSSFCFFWLETTMMFIIWAMISENDFSLIGCVICVVEWCWSIRDSWKVEWDVFHSSCQLLCNIFKILFIFNWRITALQFCVGFCHTSVWISHRYTYVPFLLNLLPTPLGYHRAPAWVPWVIQQIPTGYLFYIW